MGDSTLTVTDGSHIDGNTAATVSPPASPSPLSSRLILKGQSTLGRYERETRRYLGLEETLRSHACPLAVWRRCLRDSLFHADGDGRLQHRQQHR